MISWLISLFHIHPDPSDMTAARYKVCRLLGYLGIFFNFLLFASKYTIGFLVGSVAIKGDAVNNLTDFMSNIISILSFRLAEKPADKEHPYGHERTETIAALFMGMIIVYLGIEMLRQSIDKIVHPGQVHFEWAAVVVLILSISVKLYMYSYNRKYGRIYDSSLLEANAIDSRNDTLGTLLVLASTLISPLIHYDLDGVMGVVVSGIIFFSAYGLLRDVISSLLGEAPDEELINEMTDRIMSSPMVIDVHDIAVHTYGPKYRYATAHVEVDGTMSLMDAHAQADRIEREIMDAMNIELVIHIDPILLDDASTAQAQSRLDDAIAAVHGGWSFQDFRIEEPDRNHQILYFDLIVPYGEQRDPGQIEQLILDHLPKDRQYVLKMRVVHPFS